MYPRLDQNQGRDVYRCLDQTQGRDLGVRFIADLGGWRRLPTPARRWWRSGGTAAARGLTGARRGAPETAGNTAPPPGPTPGNTPTPAHCRHTDSLQGTHWGRPTPGIL